MIWVDFAVALLHICGNTSRINADLVAALIDSKGLPGLTHGDDIFRRDVCLDVVYSGKNKSAARSQCFNVLFDVFSYFIRCGRTQYTLCIHATAPNYQVPPEST